MGFSLFELIYGQWVTLPVDLMLGGAARSEVEELPGRTAEMV